MSLSVVQAPVTLLRDPTLTAAAKLLWLVACYRVAQGPVSHAELAAHSGLSRRTIGPAMAQLAAAGWFRVRPADGGGPAPVDLGVTGQRVAVPGDLLINRYLSIRGRTTYGLLQLTPGFRHPLGAFTYLGLSQLVGASLNTTYRLVQEWVTAGWLKVDQKNRYTPVQFELRHAILDRRCEELAWVRERLKGPLGGEKLMREYLSLLVDKPYEDNAWPRFLRNPFTKAPLQFDRYYPPRVAFEFNGPQHYQVTDLFADPQALAEQQVRDLVKMGICQRERITLVVVHAEDLSLKGMQAKVGGILPLRSLVGQEALVATKIIQRSG
jgi:hypothetical protein